LRPWASLIDDRHGGADGCEKGLLRHEKVVYTSYTSGTSGITIECKRK
jgi:hypothetical protein